MSYYAIIKYDSITHAAEVAVGKMQECVNAGVLQRLRYDGRQYCENTLGTVRFMYTDRLSVSIVIPSSSVTVQQGEHAHD